MLSNRKQNVNILYHRNDFINFDIKNTHPQTHTHTHVTRCMKCHMADFLILHQFDEVRSV